MFFSDDFVGDIERLRFVEEVEVRFDELVLEEVSLSSLFVKEGDFLVFVFFLGGGVMLALSVLFLGDDFRVGMLII